MFPRLQYLKLQFNDLFHLDANQYKIPTALPGNWTTGPERGFPSLSILTLYPGNEYLCSLPADDGSFQDVNLGEPVAQAAAACCNAVCGGLAMSTVATVVALCMP